MDRRTFTSLLGFGLAACATGPHLGCARTPLRMGIHPWIGFETLYMARDFGWLPASVRLHEGRVAGDSLAGLSAGHLDAAALTLDEVLVARSRGLPMVIVAVFDASAGADMVLARPWVAGLKGLAGLRIGHERSALGALMLAKTLEAAGLRLDQVQALDIPPDRQLAAWRAGAVDAVVTYEPAASHLQTEGAVRLLDSRQFPELVFDVLAVRRDRIALRGGAVRGLVRAHFRGLEHLRLYHVDAVHRIAAREGVTVAELQQAIAGVNLPTLAGNRAYLGEGSRLALAAEAVAGILVAERILPGPRPLAGLLDGAYLPDEPEPVR